MYANWHGGGATRRHVRYEYRLLNCNSKSEALLARAGAAGETRPTRAATRSGSSVQGAARGRRERTIEEPPVDRNRASSSTGRPKPWFISYRKRRRGRFLLALWADSLHYVPDAHSRRRAVQGKKKTLSAAGTVAAGVRRRRARRHMGPSAGAGRWRRVLENPPDRGRWANASAHSSRTRSSAWRGTRGTGPPVGVPAPRAGAPPGQGRRPGALPAHRAGASVMNRLHGQPDE